ncbi:MAG TPA: FlgD immunoglobulin-like domain containing protein, partial [bacterium]|nr:FlgD immunoglobulin-like domain containing protein [bacterium]
QTLDGHGDWVHTVVFAPSGDVVVSGGRTGSTPKLKFWDIETGETIRYYDESAYEIDFSADGEYFVYGRSTGLAVARTGLLAGVDDPDVEVAESRLAAPRPNPFAGQTTISFRVPAGEGRTELAIYDIAGRKVRTLVNGRFGSGRRSVAWDGTDSRGVSVASGIYYCRLKTREGEESIKLTLLK